MLALPPIILGIILWAVPLPLSGGFRFILLVYVYPSLTLIYLIFLLTKIKESKVKKDKIIKKSSLQKLVLIILILVILFLAYLLFWLGQI